VVTRRKYGNKPTIVDGLKFDSAREAKRWQELKLLERARSITELERQITYELAPSVSIAGEARRRPALRFKLDFRYFDREGMQTVHEDCKGFADTAFRIRQHLMKSVHGIDVVLS
jgi:hypothetical protein